MKRARQVEQARVRAAVLCVALGLTSVAAAQERVAIPPAAHAPTAPGATVTIATAPSLGELNRLGRDLQSAERASRRAAWEGLRTLSDDARPAIEARLQQIAAQSSDRDAVLAAMTAFRHVQGVALPEAEVDLAKGVLPVLEKQRSPATALAAELVALLRALEAQKTPQAGELIVGKLFALDSKLFRYEAPRTQERLGILLIPGLIRALASPKPWLREYGAAALNAMGVTAAGRAVQQDDVSLLSAILEAYGDTLAFDAMPVVVSYVTDERLEVRRAARKAVERFGRNAIWQIRERYRNASGRDADLTWTYQRTLKELYRLHDEPRQQAFDAALTQARAALAKGSLPEARAVLDAALIRDPTADSGKGAAPLYAQIGQDAFARDDLNAALAAYRRALRLDPQAPNASALSARIAYLEGELRLVQGVVDLETYRRADTLDPPFEAAREALDELTGERAAREARTRRLLGLGAALLMAMAGATLLRRRLVEPTSTDPDPPPPPEAERSGGAA